MDDELHDSWRSVISEHLAPAAVHRLLGIFAPAIRQQYPQLEDEFGDLSDWSIGQRYVDDPESCVLLADVQISYHAPVPNTTAQDRGPHLKMTNKLLICQLLMRLFEDDSEGGELQLYTRPDKEKLLVVTGDQEVVAGQGLILEKTIPYRANTAVAFLNTPESIQTMAPRRSDKPLMYLNMIFEHRRPLFSLKNVTDRQVEKPPQSGLGHEKPTILSFINRIISGGSD